MRGIETVMHLDFIFGKVTAVYAYGYCVPGDCPSSKYR
jgi:hypothetical protein